MRDWFRGTVGGLPAAFWYLWTGTLINRLGSFILVFLAIYLTRERGFSALQAGLVIGMWGAGGAVGTMAGGLLADRWGRRPTLLTAHLGAATMMVTLGLAREPWMVAVGALLLGLFAEASRPAFGAMMIDVVPEKDRLRAFSLNYWAINLGFAFAAVLAGLAAETSYLLLFLVDATTTLTTALVIFVKVAETRTVVSASATRTVVSATKTRTVVSATKTRALGGATVTGATRPLSPKDGARVTAGPARNRAVPGGGGLRAVLGDRIFLGFVLLNLFSALVFLQHISMLPITMGEDGLSPSTYGSVIALNGVLIVAGQLFVPRLIRGRSRSHVLALAALIMGLGFGLTALADAAWFFGVTVLIWTLGEMLSSPSNSTLIAELSPADQRGRYQGVFSLSWQLAGASAPILGGLVRERLGDTELWLGCAAIGAFLAIAHLLSGPARERRALALRTAAPRPVASEPRTAGPRPVPSGPRTAAPRPVAPVPPEAPALAAPPQAGESAALGPAAALAQPTNTSTPTSEPAANETAAGPARDATSQVLP